MCMAKKKKKQHGHYCRICGEFKANEKFSGKGHAQHICKSCMSQKKKGELISDGEAFNDHELLDFGFYDMEYDMFNPDIDIEPLFAEPVVYKKLDKETKSAIRTLWSEIVEEYWEEERLIPLKESFNRLKNQLLNILRDEGEIALKDDKDVKAVLHDNMLVIINKLLNRENSYLTPPPKAAETSRYNL